MLWLSIFLAQTPVPTQTPNTVQEWVVYIAGTFGTLWAGDKLWWHTRRIRSRRMGQETMPSFDEPSLGIDKLVKQQEKQHQVLSSLSDNQHRHIETTQDLARRITELEHKLDSVLQQVHSNAKDLEHLKDLQRLRS